MTKKIHINRVAAKAASTKMLYVCSLCEESFSKKSNWDRHVETLKHKRQLDEAQHWETEQSESDEDSSWSSSVEDGAGSESDQEGERQDELQHDDDIDGWEAEVAQDNLDAESVELGLENLELEEEREQEREANRNRSTEWYPYRSKELFLADVLMNLPRQQLSDDSLATIWWVFEELGINMPSVATVRKVSACLAFFTHFGISISNVPLS
jgi:hypothetical protein